MKNMSKGKSLFTLPVLLRANIMTYIILLNRWRIEIQMIMIPIMDHRCILMTNLINITIINHTLQGMSIMMMSTMKLFITTLFIIMTLSQCIHIHKPSALISNIIS